MPKVYEVNFDGLIGPTHNFSGLANGNIASTNNKFSLSHPKQAALEGLTKMKLVYSLGCKQGFIPPQTRPNIDILRQSGYRGSDEDVILNVAHDNLQLLLMVSSASSMWVANAATVTPSSDSIDQKVHITPANLVSHKHRLYESNQTFEFLKQIFSSKHFIVHQPINDENKPDEGAANHMRLCANHSTKGIHIFVYGFDQTGQHDTQKFKARQSREAFEHIVVEHKIPHNQVVFVQQNPDVIDRGVFHNDVIAMSNENVLVYHEKAYCHSDKFIDEVKFKYQEISNDPIHIICVTEDQLSVSDAVKSYIFNSQIITKEDGSMIMIAPVESEKGSAREVIDQILQKDNPINEVKFVSLNQSMLNGGGPACLRLRVPLTEEEIDHVNMGFLLNDQKINELNEWIENNYRDELTVDDLKTIHLYLESMNALNKLIPIISR